MLTVFLLNNNATCHLKVAALPGKESIFLLYVW